jgi:hypothetical protein
MMQENIANEISTVTPIMDKRLHDIE